MKPAMTLRRQLFLLQSVIMLIVIVGTGVTVAWLQENQLRDSYRDRMIAVARSVATLPAVLDAFDDVSPSAVIQPIARVVRDASDVDYVVVTDDEGIRYSHPDTSLIGKMVSTPPDALDGKTFVGTQTGTLGTSWRVKVPVFNEQGAVIGQVSVGILESDLRSAYMANIGWLGLSLGIAAVIGVVLSSGAAYLVRRRIYGLEPDEIKAMLDTRDATLHGIGDGIVVLDRDARIVLCNDAALRLLGRAEDASPVGENIAAVLAVTLDHDGETGTAPQLALAGERVLVARVDPVIVDGREVGTVIILMDRTELDTALRDLAGAQGMAEALRAQQHEFANTLHTLGGLLELGEYGAASRFIARAGGATDGDHGTVPASIGDLEVAALLIAKRARARERGVTVEVQAETRIEEAGDDSRDRITVIGNLLDNAVEALGSGGTVVIQLSESDDALHITVDDDGPGIAANDRDRVFALAHSSKADGGGLPRGYGLTLVHRVTQRVGGTVTITRSPLGGARFAVTLPRPRESELA